MTSALPANCCLLRFRLLFACFALALRLLFSHTPRARLLDSTAAKDDHGPGTSQARLAQSHAARWPSAGRQ